MLYDFAYLEIPSNICTLLHYEKMYKGMKNKQYLLMCGVFQCSNLPVVKGVFFKINISIYFSVHPNVEKPVNGIYVSRCYTTFFLPEVMLFVYCYVCFVFFGFLSFLPYANTVQ
jgi:hypothetical protein